MSPEKLRANTQAEKAKFQLARARAKIDALLQRFEVDDRCRVLLKDTLTTALAQTDLLAKCILCVRLQTFAKSVVQMQLEQEIGVRDNSLRP